MPASLYNQSHIHQSVGGCNNSSELSMDPIGGGLIDNRNGTGGVPDDRSAAEQLALQLAYLQGGGSNSNTHSSVQQHLQNNSISANNHLNINQSHSYNNQNSGTPGLHQTSSPPGGSLCTGANITNGIGTPNHSSLANFSDISGMSSGAGDLLGTSVGLGNNGSLLNGHCNGLGSNGFGGSLEDLNKMMGSNGLARKSQNMTECVPVPTSEHVAEIVGRQGCKIKALRAKTNTYIKTPVRGEEPVFVVTGRKEDVALAKAEILSAADHFSQIRASRKSNINSTLAFGQMVANQPGQTTEQVRVPYRVVGLVVGPKGATIKRIQQQTRTYIVTPSRDKEPVFEVTGLPENVETARKEIEAHIAFRTQQQLAAGGDTANGGGNFYGDLDDISFGGTQSLSHNNQNGINGGNNLNQHQMAGNGSSHQNLSMNGMNSGHSGNNGIMNGSSGNITNVGFGNNTAGQTNAFPSGFTQSSNGVGASNNTNSGKGIILQNLIESNNLQDLMAINGSCGSSNGGWSNGDSHDSGMGSSPPFDGIRGSMGGMGGSNGLSNGVVGTNGISQNTKPLLSHQSSLPATADGMGNPRGNGSAMGTSSLLWGELNKALGGLDLSSTTASTANHSGHNQMNQLQGNMTLNNELNKNQYTNIGARSSLDLGSLGRSDQSASVGASVLASQLLHHQQQINGGRSGNNRDILSEMDNTNNPVGCNMRGSSLLQQNLEELLQHQNQNTVRVPSSPSSTSGVSSSSPPESLQNMGSMMKNAACLLSSTMNDTQNNKNNDGDQVCLDPSATTSSSTNEPEKKPDEGRNGIIAI